MKKIFLSLIMTLAIVPVMVSAEELSLYDTIKNSSTGLSKNDSEFITTYEGNGVTEFEEKGEKVYIYTGSSDKINNFTRIDDMCFLILRTTYKKGVKLLYYGPYKDGKCTLEKKEGKYNGVEELNHPYVGYMYGEINNVGPDITFETKNNSTIKNQLDKFYDNKLKDYESWMSDDIYCNDKDFDGDAYNGYSNRYKYYIDNTGVTYDLECREKDAFTVENEDGNKALDRYIGTITLSEFMLTLSPFEGTAYSMENYNNWLYSVYGEAWTMTSSYSAGYVGYYAALNRTTNIINKNHRPVNETYTVIPNISINKRVFVKGGKGDQTDPYILEYTGLVSGEIVWKDSNDADGIRPEEVTITVYANNKQIDRLKVSAKNGWRFKLDVSKYTEEGQTITYKVDQNSVEGYELSIKGNQQEGFVITNTHIVVAEDNPPTGLSNFIIIPAMIIVFMIGSYFIVKKNDLFKSNS